MQQNYPQQRYQPLSGNPSEQGGSSLSKIGQSQLEMESMGSVNGSMVRNGFQKLQDCQGIFIRQYFEVSGAITNFETPNVYKVYPADAKGKKIENKTIFRSKDKSNCWERQCYPGDCRPFNMKVSNDENAFMKGSLDASTFLELVRPFQFTFLCYNLPEMSVTCIENGKNKLIGKLKNPFTLCSIGVNIEDASGNLLYTIEGSQFQAGYLCRELPFKACQETRFEVKNSSGDVVTHLFKKSAGCSKAFIGDTHHFSVGFPPNSSPENKSLLLAACLFIDCIYFESKSQNSNVE